MKSSRNLNLISALAFAKRRPSYTSAMLRQSSCSGGEALAKILPDFVKAARSGKEFPPQKAVPEIFWTSHAILALHWTMRRDSGSMRRDSGSMRRDSGSLPDRDSYRGSLPASYRGSVPEGRGRGRSDSLPEGRAPYRGSLPEGRGRGRSDSSRESRYHRDDSANRGRRQDSGRGESRFHRGPDDWDCPHCGNICFARREACNRCSTPKPPGTPCLNAMRLSVGRQERKRPALREGDWFCPSCTNINYNNRPTCNKCSLPKPISLGQYVVR